jgi:hypothetical protein
MARKHLIFALGMIITAAPASAMLQPAPGSIPPAGTPETRYCLRAEMTGTRIPRVECLTREEWADSDVDVDEAWAKDGVRTFEGPPPTV